MARGTFAWQRGARDQKFVLVAERRAIAREIGAAQHVTRPAENGGNEGSCAGGGEAQDQGSSDAEENKEDERSVLATKNQRTVETSSSEV